MWRWVFTILAALSTLWLAAVVILAIVGKVAPRPNPRVEWQSGPHFYLTSNYLEYGWNDPWPAWAHLSEYVDRETGREMPVDLPVFGVYRQYGKYQHESDPSKNLHLTGMGISADFPRSGFVSALLPGLWALLYVTRVRARRSRELEGKCVTCGYDLRASKDRCPECGTPFVAKGDGARSPPPLA